MIVLTNEIQIMVFFFQIKFNTIIYLNLIRKPNIYITPKSTNFS